MFSSDIRQLSTLFDKIKLKNVFILVPSKLLWGNKMKTTSLPALTIALLLLAPVLAQPLPPPPTFVMVSASINQSGSTPASGKCTVYATIGKSAEALIGWTVEIFTITTIYNFLVARLLNTSLVALNYSGADLRIDGWWDVHNVTYDYVPGGSVTFTDDLLVNNGSGTLMVTGGWSQLAVTIFGTPPLVVALSGSVRYYAIRGTEIPLGDVSGPTVGVPDGKIDILDLVYAARAYGATPGDPSNPNYDFSCDFSLVAPYRINIYDLTTIAANLGKSY
jgi:hypothetical protein